MSAATPDPSTAGQADHTMEFDQVVDIFPKMEDREFAELKEDIRTNGLHEPIWIHKGKIIDGRHRYLACLEVGVTPVFREWDEKGDLTDFVLSCNLHRRHLTVSQRSAIAAELTTLLKGQHPDRQNCRSLTQKEAAKALNVSTRSVGTARKILKRSGCEAIAEIKAGNLSLPEAAEIADLPPSEQKEILVERKEEIAKTGIRKPSRIRPVASPLNPTKRTPPNPKIVSELGQHLMLACKMAKICRFRDVELKVQHARHLFKQYKI